MSCFPKVDKTVTGPKLLSSRCIQYPNVKESVLRNIQTPRLGFENIVASDIIPWDL